MNSSTRITSFSKLKREVEHYSTLDIIAACNRASVECSEESNNIKQLRVADTSMGFIENKTFTFGQWDIALLAKFSILYGHNYSGKNLSKRDFIRLISLGQYLPDPFTLKPRDELNTTDLAALALRLVNQQFPLQEKPFYGFSRSIALYSQLSANRKLPDGRSIKEAFGTLYRMDVLDFIMLGFLLYAVSNTDTPKFTLSNIVDGRGGFEEEDVNVVLSRISADRKLFSNVHELTRARDRAYTKYEFNPLLKYPIVAFESDYLAPVPDLLLDRVTQGIYYDGLDNFREEGHRNDFAANFGYVFEDYVGELLKAEYGPENVTHEPEYGGRDNMRGPDWIVIDGDDLLAIECRTSRLSLRTKSLGDVEALPEELRRILVDTLEKFQGKISALPTTSLGQGVRQFNAVYPLVVTLDRLEPYQLMVRNIDEQLKKRGVERYPYHLMSVASLEQLLALRHLMPLRELFRERSLTREKLEQPLSFHINDMAQKAMERTGSIPRLNYLQQIFDQFSANLEVKMAS